MSLDTELSDFNWHYLSQYGKIKFYAAGRLWDAMTFDKAPINPYRLACEFYARYGFSFSPDDFYRQGNRMRYKCIDDLVKENPSQLSDVGQMLFDGWLGFKKNLDAQRSKEPKLPTIPPPPPTPPPVVVEEPKKLPEVPTPKPPKTPFPTGKVIATVLAILVGASAFLPPPYSFLASALLKLLQAAFGG
jgi:hypothetical protein